jgi:hypothetical protein
VQPRVIEPVHRVTPAPTAPVTKSATSGTSDSLVVSISSIEALAPSAGTALALVSPLSASPVVLAQPESIVAIPAATAAPEVVPSTSRATDPGAALSLMSMGTNKVVATPSTAPATVKTSTNALDELYRLLGTPFMNSNAGVSGGDSTDELTNGWDLESFLLGMAVSDSSDELVSE